MWLRQHARLPAQHSQPSTRWGARAEPQVFAAGELLVPNLTWGQSRSQHLCPLVLLGRSLPPPGLKWFLGFCCCLDGATDLLVPPLEQRDGARQLPSLPMCMPALRAAAGPAVTVPAGEGGGELFSSSTAAVGASRTWGVPKATIQSSGAATESPGEL